MPPRREVSIVVLVVAAWACLTMRDATPGFHYRLLAAQQARGSKTGNPTPGTPQPDPPNVADRITVTGCVERSRTQTGGRSAAAADPNDPSDARFVLVKAKRVHVVPPDTGTSAAAAGAASETYRLRAIDSQLSPFVGTRVEISGEILASRAGPATSENASVPVLAVEFVQKQSPSCQ